MRFPLTILFTIFFITALSSSGSISEVSQCFISFKNATHLTAAALDRLPETSAKFRMVKTEDGDVEVTRIDGYRILYNNEKQAPFVNLKVELSDAKAYQTDQKRLLDHLKYLNSHSIGMETKELLELQFNGYKVIGFSRASIEKASTLGTFLLFPGDGTTVYIYFNNLKPGYRHFETVEDYKRQRDQFLDEYTKHINSCKKSNNKIKNDY